MSRTRTTAAVLLVGAVALSSACATSTKKNAGAAPASSGNSTASTASSSPTESPTPTPSPTKDKSSYTNMALGTPITVTGKDGSADYAFSVTAGPMQTSTKAVSQYGEKPKGTYVGITVTYDCATGSCTYNPYDFTMRAADGTEVDQAFEGYEPTLRSGALNTGTKAKGVITYDLTAGSYSLEYRTNSLDSDAATWVVPVT